MAHYQQGQHGQPTTRVDEYGNPIPGGHGIQGQGHAGGGYGATGTGSYDDAAGYGHGRQAGYGATGTGMHDVGGFGGSGQPAYGATGTGLHDAGGPGGYGATSGPGPHGTHGVTGIHGAAGGMRSGGTHGVTGMGTHGTHGATGVTGTHSAATGAAFPHAAAEHKTGGVLHRSGSSSSSSSSSEDDGMGGRRKKGLKEKIKDKMPGGHKDNLGQATATGGYGGAGYAAGGPTTGTGGTTTGGTTYAPTTEGTHEKKGVMEKIKEKIPGGHKDSHQQHTTTATGGYAPGRTGTTDTYGTTAEGTHDKKGFVEKIKEKLPGQH